MRISTQQAIYEFVKQHYKRYHQAPTVTEIGSAVGISSRGTVYRHLQNLASKGLLKLAKGRHRNIELPTQALRPGQLPILGRIAAGQPIEATSEPDYALDIGELFSRGNLFVLEVKGHSMCDIGILDGDKVICESRSIAMNGEIVVALVDGHEATLKRFYNNQDGTVTLAPENDTMQPMLYSADRITIQGIWVGLIRLK